jgi:DnaJ-class molecular chaperone
VRAPVLDYYVILGVARSAGASELRRAYRTLALRFHPDRAGIQSTEVFQRISEAYGVLSDANARTAYDARLRAAEAASAPRTGTAGPAPNGAAQQGDAYGPGGKISWRRGGRDPARADDLIDRLCGSLEALHERGAVRHDPEGVLEMLVRAAEVTDGGTAAVDMAIDATCPTCYGHANPGRLWCRRCDYAGTVREPITVCVPIPAGVADGATFTVPTAPDGRAAPLRVRIRVSRV